MPKIIASAAINGAHKIVDRAEKKWQEAMDKWGANEPVGFPNTAYYLPIIYGMSAMKVEKLIIMTSTLGVLRDPNDSSSLVTFLSPQEAKEMIKKKHIIGGMMPKVESALHAISKGIPRIHIINGLTSHSLLLEVLTTKGAGTMIATPEEIKKYRSRLKTNS